MSAREVVKGFLDCLASGDAALIVPYSSATTR